MKTLTRKPSKKDQWFMDAMADNFKDEKGLHLIQSRQGKRIILLVRENNNNLQGLLEEYKVSLSIMAGRVKEIRNLIKSKSLLSENPNKDPEIIDLKDRLKPLYNMYLDLKETTKEVENYYDRSYWRNEKLTMNSVKIPKLYYSPYIYD